MTNSHRSPASRTRSILVDLEAVRENLLGFSDDIWANIDRQDLAAFDEGVQFMRTYVEKMAQFDEVATGISALIQQYTSIRLDQTEETGGDDVAQNERIIAELNREEPHTLDEDFTWKRPHGFILAGQAATGLTTWQRLYELACQQFYARNPDIFRSLVAHEEFISNRGHHTVTSDRQSLRKAMAVADDLFIEANLSANSIRDVLSRLLDAYEFPHTELKIFLRQDRDAAREESQEI
jgi:hypothetical protein